MNVDSQEIAKFEAIASHWWDPHGDFKPLHLMNPLRLEWISDHCEGLFGKQVLDVGCGGGILSESMAKQGAQVLGVDMGHEPLQVARLHALEQNVKLDYQRITVEELAEQRPASFDVVTCMEMLEHVPDPASIVRACAKLAKPGGKLFFSTINRTRQSWLLMILAAEQVLKIVPKGTHDHAKFIRPAELIRCCDSADLLTKQVKGVRYNPLTEHFKLSDDVSVNYQIFCEKP
ncbi:MAG: bifunctional 2-polyprenyl-6-hydroxyphenol methylase/3-demethylubiquinol 3-O-methyltransferase UbiG [Tolumonas sp.]|jgi:2-polyprenyl-6-hydroxyphenyl methylase/3-demethylubiquinone-9 3-methyltransferase|uniref:bifunctional 2-polyprenyl-6-hydroxyphenol methylase/3-demethylubiquinol 3-O-methyltransferase UbiG n=1 Tax=uncultured Tolumonas sp. TaxID=263765 RepID=UPI002A0A7215|nr:bifunctional 2-polyprenyl-6-hydroxyphenol methylase/3-demethylubiquinol 3-O-methyltransferase UbiG [uncultured Tolumonas sp.]MDD2342038.1 bifunctional 2-polyprenyl-6-hydroxyphenol methylase/3-demethylubiquinol 3-O-methyltransferase UbiG [Tolumonas sp.]